MTGLDFLDTNVLAYSLDLADPRKHQVARELFGRAVQQEFTISGQVVAELAAMLLQKYASQFSGQDVIAVLDSLRSVPLIAADVDLAQRAVEAHAAYGIHFYDGMIVAAAERAGSSIIWSEDLNAGQEYFGVKIKNPFA
jgi:predicted nucleic acid-binding protein